MKKHPYFSIAVLMICFFTATMPADAQPCLEEGGHYLLLSQNDIDSFNINFPGCREVNGSLHILGDSITNLEGLKHIRSVADVLEISNVDHLKTLTGLDSLQSVGGMIIWHNDSLQDLHGLENLSQVGEGIFRILDNLQLESLQGLQNLQSVGSSLLITNIPKLSNLEGLNRLKRVELNLVLAHNSTMTSLQGLDSLQVVGQQLEIFENPALNSLMQQNAMLDSVLLDVLIYENPQLSSLHGLESLSYVGRDFLIYNNPVLADLLSLSSLQKVGRTLLLDSNFPIQSLEGLEALQTTGSLWIANQDALQDLHGLEHLQLIEELLFIQGNENLLSLNGLQSLQKIKAQLILYYNPQLQDIQALSQISPYQLEFLQISNCPALAFCGLTPICTFLRDDGLAIIQDNAIPCDSPERVLKSCSEFNADNPLMRDSLAEETAIFVKEEMHHITSPTLSLHPNPASSQLLLQIHLPKGSGTEGLLPYELSVYDLWGQLVMRENEVWEIEHRLQLKELPAGSYLLVLRLPEASLVRRFVVIK